MKKAYNDPSLHISMFDEEDDIVTLSGVESSEDQAQNAIEQYSEGSGVSVYSVDVKTN